MPHYRQDPSRCYRGHSLDGAYVNPKGEKVCRICRTASQKRHYARAAGEDIPLQYFRVVNPVVPKRKALTGRRLRVAISPVEDLIGDLS